MKIKIVLFVLAGLLASCSFSCTNPSTWDKSFNPLDQPAQNQPSVEDYHNKNAGFISSNPARRYKNPVDLW